MGWLRDLWRLPEYVKDANSDPAYEKELSKKMKETEIPPWKTARWMGMLRKWFAFSAGYCYSVVDPRIRIDFGRLRPDPGGQK